MARTVATQQHRPSDLDSHARRDATDTRLSRPAAEIAPSIGDAMAKTGTSGPTSVASAPSLDLHGMLRRADPRIRARLAAQAQAHAGNAAVQRAVERRRPVQREADPIPPNPYVIETPGGGATTELPANPYVEENEPVTLANIRFTGIARLGRIASGGAPLGAADNGPAVQAVQQALVDLGYSLLNHDRDGHFGAETRDAIAQFRTDRGLTGDAMNARALGLLDSSAPPPGRSREHYLDYERLFADGFLDITFALGYDESGSHTDQLADVRAGLVRRGFTAEAPAAGAEPTQYRLRRDVTYPLSSGNRATREIIVRATIIAPGGGAAAQFGSALADFGDHDLFGPRAARHRPRLRQ